MKILHVVPTYLPAVRYGGPIYSVHGLCKALVDRGHDVHVFTTNVDGRQDSLVPLGRAVDSEGVKVWYFPCGRRSREIARRLYYSKGMKMVLREKIREFDLLHNHSIFLWPTAMAARIAKESQVPYIVSPRGMLVRRLFEKKNKWIKWAWFRSIEKRNLETAAAVHFTSRLEAREAAEFGLCLREQAVVPNGVDMDSCLRRNDKKGARSHEPKLLFLGRINWEKGLDRLINAMAYGPQGQLIIAGNDEENYRPVLENLAKQCGVSSKVTFMGPVFGSEKADLLKSADLFVLPSYSENFGVSVLEAMAVGCPVVVTPGVGLADVVAETGCGLVVNGDPETLGKEIQSLLAQEKRLLAMGEQGQRVARERFSWRTVGKDMEKFYEIVLERQQRMQY